MLRLAGRHGAEHGEPAVRMRRQLEPGRVAAEAQLRGALRQRDAEQRRRRRAEHVRVAVDARARASRSRRARRRRAGRPRAPPRARRRRRPGARAGARRAARARPRAATASVQRRTLAPVHLRGLGAGEAFGLERGVRDRRPGSRVARCAPARGARRRSARGLRRPSCRARARKLHESSCAPGSTGPYQRSSVAAPHEALGHHAERHLEGAGARGQRGRERGRAPRASRRPARSRCSPPSFWSASVSIARSPPGSRSRRTWCSRDARPRAGRASARPRAPRSSRPSRPARTRRARPGTPRPRKRAPTSQPIAGSFATFSKAKRPARVARRAPQPRHALGGERVERDLGAGHRRAGLRAQHDALDARGAGRHVGRRRLGQAARGSARRRERERARCAARSHAPLARPRSGCGHITSAVPSTKVKPPSQIQFTSGFLRILSVAAPSASIAVRIT